MDKQTLSGYGWIVIVTLVLAVLLALATPFGTYVGDGVVTTVNGLINTSSKAVDEDQIDTMSDKWENKFSTFDKVGSVNDGNEETLAPGLYDENDVMLASWDELVNDYGWNIEGSDSFIDINTMLSNILKINSQLSTGVKIVISPDLTNIGGGLFMDCKNLTSIIIPNSITNISGNAFRNCTALTSITIPDSVTNISGNAFFNCTSLTSITIGDGVTSIGKCAFQNCTSLTSIYIPKSVSTISANSNSTNLFLRCSSELKIYCGASQSEIQSNWYEYWNVYGDSFSSRLSVTYDITRAEYEALIAE